MKLLRNLVGVELLLFLFFPLYLPPHPPAYFSCCIFRSFGVPFKQTLFQAFQMRRRSGALFPTGSWIDRWILQEPLFLAVSCTVSLIAALVSHRHRGVGVSPD